jgi:superfamily II DNA/RNA helicase
MTWDRFNTAGKTVIKLPRVVEKRAIKRLETKKLEALRESGTSYPRGNRDIPPIISCRRTELNHYFGQRYNPFVGKFPLASEHWASRKTIGDYFSFSAFRGSPATQWHKILQRKLEREQMSMKEDTKDILAMAEERGLLIFKGGEYGSKDHSNPQRPTFRSSPYASQIDPLLLDAVEGCGFKCPTNIQDISIPVLLTGESAIIASETGNGKTLAFLLPVLQRSMKIKAAIKKAAFLEEKSKSVPSTEIQENDTFSKFTSLLNHKNRPLAVIIAPSRELATQIYQTAMQLSKAAVNEVAAKSEVKTAHDSTCSTPLNAEPILSRINGLDLRIKLVLGGKVDERINTESKSRVDVVIGTIGALTKMFEYKHYYPGSVCSLVFDEADTLLDETFKNLTAKVLAKLCRVDPDVTEALSITAAGPTRNIEEPTLGETQVLFVGATMPSKLSDTPIGSLVDADQLKVLRTGQLHRVLPHVNQVFIRAPKVKREEYLFRLIEKDVKNGNPIVIFSNKTSTSNFIAHVINDRFRDMSSEDNQQIMQPNAEPTSICIAFNSSLYWQKRTEILSKFTNGDINILSCTDLASRGLDLCGRATHVINYDFPCNISDYLHRAGRVGRVGQAKIGKVTSLVCGQVSIAVVQELERSMRLNQELANVDANVGSIIRQRHLSKADANNPEL